MKTTNHRRAGAALLALCSMAAAPACAQEDTAFDVNIVLSEKAAATLSSRGEAMVIMVSYYGWPKPSAKKHGDEVGQIGFGPDRQIEIPGKAGLYHVPAVKLDPQRIGWLEGPVQVNVNIASARKSDPDNLLDCESIDGPLAEAHKTTRTLPCRLIRNDPAPPKQP